MDYLKLALLKAEELEKKTGSVLPPNRKGLLIQKQLEAKETYTVCKIRGKGDAALVLSLDFAPFDSSVILPLNGSLGLVIDGQTVFSRPLSSSVLFTASVVLNGETSIKIKADSAVRLVCADVLAIGGEILAPVGSDVKIDFIGGVIGAVYESEGEIRLCCDSAPPNLGQYVIAGFGQSPAIAAFLENDKPCFAVVFVDGGELVLSLFDGNKRQLVCKYTGVKAESAALVRYGGSLAVGYISKGVAYVGLVARPEYAISQSFKVEKATGIEFIKDALPAAIVLNKNGKNIIRTAQPEAVYDDAIYVSFQCTSS